MKLIIFCWVAQGVQVLERVRGLLGHGVILDPGTEYGGSQVGIGWFADLYEAADRHDAEPDEMFGTARPWITADESAVPVVAYATTQMSVEVGPDRWVVTWSDRQGNLAARITALYATSPLFGEFSVDFEKVMEPSETFTETGRYAARSYDCVSQCLAEVLSTEPARHRWEGVREVSDAEARETGGRLSAVEWLAGASKTLRQKLNDTDREEVAELQVRYFLPKDYAGAGDPDVVVKRKFFA